MRFSIILLEYDVNCLWIFICKIFGRFSSVVFGGFSLVKACWTKKDERRRERKVFDQWGPGIV